MTLRSRRKKGQYQRSPTMAISGCSSWATRNSPAGLRNSTPTKLPKHIDLTHESGPHKGETLLGIYKLFGDEYTACIAAPGKARPTEFASQAGSWQRLVICKREKHESSDEALGRTWRGDTYRNCRYERHEDRRKVLGRVSCACV